MGFVGRLECDRSHTYEPLTVGQFVFEDASTGAAFFLPLERGAIVCRVVLESKAVA